MTQLGRAALVTAALAIVGASASVAHDPQGDLARLQQELDALRTEKRRLEDQNVELGRRFDREKQRLVEEKHELQVQNARQQRELAQLREHVDSMKQRRAAEAGPAPASTAASPLDSRVITADFDGTPLGEVVAFVQDVGGVRLATQGAGGVIVDVRLRALSVRAALDHIAANARDPAGERVELSWSQDPDPEGLIVIERAR